MSYRDKNLAAANERGIYSKITLDKLSKCRLDDSISNQQSKDGSNILTAAIDGIQYRFNSAYRPLGEADNWAAQFDMRNRMKVVSMFGFGNGYLIRSLLGKCSETDRIIIYEPSIAIFCYVLETYDVSDLLKDGRITVAVNGLNTSAFYEQLETSVDWTNVECQLYAEHPVYDKVFATQKALFYEIIRRNNTRVLTDRNTEMHFGHTIVVNTLKNIKHIGNSITLTDLKAIIPAGMPAFIISAGPSLDDNILELKRAVGHGFIIATDSAVTSLLKAGVRPDITISIDAEKSLRCYEAEEAKKIPLICEIQSRYEIVSQQNAKLIFMHCIHFFTDLYRTVAGDIPDFRIGGSVATAAFGVCEYLNFKNIILVGQDLAYKNGASHTGNQVLNIQGEEEGICYLTGIDGSPIKSRHDWRGYLSWFEEEIVRIDGKVRIIDATEGGALIKGTELMTLHDAVDMYCIRDAFDCRMAIEELPSRISKEKNACIDGMMKSRVCEIDKLLNNLPQNNNYCCKAIELCEQNDRIDDEIVTLRRNIEAFHKQIEDMNVYPLIDACIRSTTYEIFKDINLYKENEKKDFMDFFNGALKLHEAVKTAAGEIKALISDN